MSVHTVVLRIYFLNTIVLYCNMKIFLFAFDEMETGANGEIMRIRASCIHDEDDNFIFNSNT